MSAIERCVPSSNGGLNVFKDRPVPSASKRTRCSAWRTWLHGGCWVQDWRNHPLKRFVVCASRRAQPARRGHLNPGRSLSALCGVPRACSVRLGTACARQLEPGTPDHSSCPSRNADRRGAQASKSKLTQFNAEGAKDTEGTERRVSLEFGRPPAVATFFSAACALTFSGRLNSPVTPARKARATPSILSRQ